PGRPSISSTSTPTVVTSPTATDRPRLTATTWCTPPTATHQTRSGSSTAWSICCPPRRDDPRVQVQRRRMRDGKPTLLRRFGRLRLRTVTVISAAAVLALTGTGIAVGSTIGFGTDHVGQKTGQGLVVSDDQFLKPL